MLKLPDKIIDDMKESASVIDKFKYEQALRRFNDAPEPADEIPQYEAPGAPYGEYGRIPARPEDMPQYEAPITEADKRILNPPIDTTPEESSLINELNQWGSGKLSWDKVTFDKSAFSRAMRQAGITPSEVITMPDWNRMTEDKKQLVARLYTEDPYKGNEFASQVASANIVSQSDPLAGMMLAPISSIGTPFAKLSTGQEVSKEEWIDAAIMAALMAVPGLQGLGGVAKTAAKGIMAGTGAYSTAQTVKNWDAMSPTERAMAIGMDVVLIAGGSPGKGFYKKAISQAKQGTEAMLEKTKPVVKELATSEVGGVGKVPKKGISPITETAPKAETLAPKVEQPVEIAPKLKSEGLKPAESIVPPEKPPAKPVEATGGQGIPPKEPPTTVEPKPTPQDPYNQLVNSLTEEKIPLKDKITEAKDKFMRQFYDRNRPLKELEESTGVPTHKLAQVVPGSTAAGENVLRKFYRPVLANVQKDIKYLEQYMVGMRNTDIIARSPEAKLPGGLAGATNLKALETLEKRLGTERFNSVKKAAEELWRLNDEQVLTPLRNEGLISEELYQSIKANNPHYIPFQRLDFVTEIDRGFGRAEANVPQTGIKKLSLEGSERTLDNPLARLESQVIQSRQLIAKNKAARGIVDALQQSEKNVGEKLVNFPKGEAEHSALLDTITYFEKGKKVTAEVPAIYAQVAKGMEWEANNTLSKVLGNLSAPLRHGAVTYNPAFLIVNPLRDAMTAFFREKLIPLSPEYLRGWVAVVKKNALYNEAADSGVLMSGIVDTMRTTNALKRVNMRGAITVKSPKDALLVLPRLVERANLIAEQSTRVATFGKLRAKGIDELEAAVRSRDVTVDFSKSGTAMKLINQIVPFSNAGVQGSANVLRVIKNNPKWAAVAATPFAMATVLSRINNMRYDSSLLIPNYEYTNNWVIQIGEIKNKDGTIEPLYIKIPKGQIGSMLTFPGEALFNYTRKDNDKSVVETVLSAGLEASKSASPVSPDVTGIMPPLMGTAVGVSTGIDPYTGIPIIPMREESLLPEQQFDVKTSRTAVGLGNLFNVSPRMIEYAIRDYTAGTGQLSMWLTDLGLGALKYSPEAYGSANKPEMTGGEKIAEVPVASRFLGTKDTRSATEGWDKLDQVTQDTNREFNQLPLVNKLGIKLGEVGSSINNVELTPSQRAEYQQFMADYVIPLMKQELSYGMRNREELADKLADFKAEVKAQFVIKYGIEGTTKSKVSTPSPTSTTTNKYNPPSTKYTLPKINYSGGTFKPYKVKVK